MSTQTDVSLDAAATPDANVAAALGLGWDMATMQAGAQPRGGREHPHRDDLATLSDLNGWEWTEIHLSSVAVALVTLTPTFEAVGLTAPRSTPPATRTLAITRPLSPAQWRRCTAS